MQTPIALFVLALAAHTTAALWLAESDPSSLSVTGVSCSSGSTKAACEYGNCGAYDLCDETCVLRPDDPCNFAFNGMVYNTYWVLDITFTEPRELVQWRVKSMATVYSIDKVQLETNGSVITGSEIVLGADETKDSGMISTPPITTVQPHHLLASHLSRFLTWPRRFRLDSRGARVFLCNTMLN